MKYRIAGIAASLVLAAAGVASATGAVTTAPPPPPGDWQASTSAGCWNSILERHVEKRTGSYVSEGGQVIKYTEFRRVTTYTRWCPRSGYDLATWHSPWGPGRR